MDNLERKELRVRIAPSPTGLLHFGTARTALFNWLFAKNKGGKFILRIEDTDLERSKKEYEDDIINGLKWLGLDWDEGPDKGGDFGPYRQSERMDIYKKYLNKLLEEQKAYYCFCTKEELEMERQEMIKNGLAPKYSGKCQNISSDNAKKRIEAGEQAVIRIKVNKEEIKFKDLIRDNIIVNSEIFGDIVIARNINSPLFTFAGVVDDYLMKISHVIRGEDHISNTPKQILIQKALGFNQPVYAHLPLILAPDRSKLSKRYIETSLNDYVKLGYLPEAMINFMAYLGWHPHDDREILGYQELIKEFDIERVQKAGAIFNLEKLDWINSQYIRNLDSDKLFDFISKFVPNKWRQNQELLKKVIELTKERLKKATNFEDEAKIFFEILDYDKNLLVWKNMDEKMVKNNLEVLYNEIEKIDEKDFYEKEKLENLLMPLAEVYGRGELLWPLRVSLSGLKNSPGPFEIMSIIGKNESLKRIKFAKDKINN